MDNSFVAVCTVGDVREFRTTAFNVDGKNILLTKIGGDIFAFENKCSHAEVPFGEKEIMNGQIQCPMHGSCFDVKTGQPMQLPAVEPIKTYEVKIEDSNVLVALEAEQLK
jgi:3-phenylpropionate/trans-cinnamate dioxygenase ferredoxin subunit